MDSFTFKRGKAYFSSDSPAVPWAVAFEDEGPTGYLYARDRTRDTPETSILDAMLIYNNPASNNASNNAPEDPARDYIASIQWSHNGLQCVFYIDASAQAFIDFAARQSFCRTNFPNFLDDQSSAWRTSSHAWNDATIEHFEAAIYA